jgi:hypothetical protein
MKPFDLQAAIAGAPIQFNNGEKLKFVAYVPEATYHDRFVFLDSKGNIGSSASDNLYIFMSPVFKTYWANVDRSEYGQVSVGLAMLDEKAVQLERSYLPRYIKTISFEIEE